MPEELLGKVQPLRFPLFVLHLLIQQDKMVVETRGITGIAPNITNS